MNAHRRGPSPADNSSVMNAAPANPPGCKARESPTTAAGRRCVRPRRHGCSWLGPASPGLRQQQQGDAQRERRKRDGQPREPSRKSETAHQDDGARSEPRAQHAREEHRHERTDAEAQQEYSQHALIDCQAVFRIRHERRPARDAKTGDEEGEPRGDTRRSVFCPVNSTPAIVTYGSGASISRGSRRAYATPLSDRSLSCLRAKR